MGFINNNMNKIEISECFPDHYNVLYVQILTSPHFKGAKEKVGRLQGGTQRNDKKRKAKKSFKSININISLTNFIISSRREEGHRGPPG